MLWLLGHVRKQNYEENKHEEDWLLEKGRKTISSEVESMSRLEVPGDEKGNIH